MTFTSKPVTIVESLAVKEIGALAKTFARFGSTPVTMLVLVLSRVGKVMFAENGVVCLIKFPDAMYEKP